MYGSNEVFSIWDIRLCSLFRCICVFHVIIPQQHLQKMANNATFHNISAISWRSALLVEETGVPGENHWPVASHWLYHIMLYRVHLAWVEFEFWTSLVTGTDCIHVCSCKSNNHMTTTTTIQNMSKRNQIVFCENKIQVHFLKLL